MTPQVVSLPNMVDLANTFVTVEDPQNHLRRNDFHVYSDSEYFKSLNPKGIKTPVATQGSSPQATSSHSAIQSPPGTQSHRMNSPNFEVFYEQHSHHKPIVQEVTQQQQQHLPQLVTLEAGGGRDALNTNPSDSLLLHHSSSENSDVMDFSNYHPSMSILESNSVSESSSTVSTTLTPFQV